MTNTTDVTLDVSVGMPRNTAKRIAREIGCSHSQAERIAKTGYIPERLWELADQLLERALDAYEQKIRQEREKLKAIRVQRMVARAQDRLDAVAVSQTRCNSPMGEEEPGEPLPLVGGAMNSFRKDGQ